jgi:hypothetical protein
MILGKILIRIFFLLFPTKKAKILAAVVVIEGQRECSNEINNAANIFLRMK